LIKHFGLDRQYLNLKHELLSATDDVLKSGIFCDGSYTNRLENWLASRTKCEYAVVVHSGTQALEIIAKYLCYVSLDLSVPLHVRIPNLTYRATLNAFVNNNAYVHTYMDRNYDVEIVDTDSHGIMLQPERESINTYNCYVGLYGAPTPDLLTSQDIVDGAQHWLIADGNVGLGMAISFDPTKNLPASGNGGAIVTNSEELYKFAKSYKDNGKHFSQEIFAAGTNSKMSEIDCAHVLVRSLYIDQWQIRRQKIRKYYIDEFKNLPIKCLSKKFYRHADQKFVIATDDRDLLRYHLLKHKIEAKVHYEQTISELPATKFLCENTLDFLTASAMLSRSVLSLPIYPELLDSEVEYIATMVKAFYDK
jgi:dTDP-4-amino-4,6-dideoxygalactose transaminase